MVKFVDTELEIEFEENADVFYPGDTVTAFGDEAKFITYDGDLYATLIFKGRTYTETVRLDRITHALPQASSSLPSSILDTHSGISHLALHT